MEEIDNIMIAIKKKILLCILIVVIVRVVDSGVKEPLFNRIAAPQIY